MKIKTLRIHADEDGEYYELFDRNGKFTKRIHWDAIYIENLPPVKHFGFCPIDSTDVTLEFVTPLDSRQIIINKNR